MSIEAVWALFSVAVMVAVAQSLRLAAARHDVAQARALAEWHRAKRLEEAGGRGPWEMICRFLSRHPGSVSFGSAFDIGNGVRPARIAWSIGTYDGLTEHGRRGELDEYAIDNRAWEQSLDREDVIREAITADAVALLTEALEGGAAGAEARRGQA